MNQKNRKVFIALSFCACISVYANICDRTPEIRDALLREIAALTGQTWDCRHIGADELSRVKKLEVAGANLKTLRPQDLVGLTSLEILDLSDNQLESFPEGLKTLANLKKLRLSYNKLSGPLPEYLGQLKNLLWISFYNNQLSGPLPEYLGQLENLWELNLVGNQFFGSIPANLGRLKKLEWLGLADNNLSGPFPESLGQLEKLRELHLWGNPLMSGPIPASWEKLSDSRIIISRSQISFLQRLALRCRGQKHIHW